MASVPPSPPTKPDEPQAATSDDRQRSTPAGGSEPKAAPTPDSSPATGTAAPVQPWGAGTPHRKPRETPVAAAIKELDWPDGNVGALAAFFYRASTRPVKEIAIATALAFMAGVGGLAYNLDESPTGLNLYILILARSGRGKEAVNTGISALVAALESIGCDVVSRFVNFDDMASGQGLRAALAEQPCFVNLSGEFGHKLIGMADRRNPAMASLRKEMTNLYHKSGRTSRTGGITRAKDEDKTKAIGAAAYSMIGDTTTATYLAALTAEMSEDGFLSRFTTIEYDGKRPQRNRKPVTTPDEGLLEWLDTLVRTAHTQTLPGDDGNPRPPIIVTVDEFALQLLDEFDQWCDDNINKNEATDDETHGYNRGHLKALRIAGLLAVAQDEKAPVISKAHATWAIDLVKRDIAMDQRHISNGDVGDGDAAREKKLLRFCKDYLTSKGAPHGYGIPDALHAEGVVPRKYFQIRIGKRPPFSTAKQGLIRGLDDAIRSLCDSGYLLEVDKLKAADSYGFQGRCYRIVNLPNGLLE